MATAARIPMIATVTSNSMREKPFALRTTPPVTEMNVNDGAPGTAKCADQRPDADRQRHPADSLAELVHVPAGVPGGGDIIHPPWWVANAIWKPTTGTLM